MQCRLTHALLCLFCAALSAAEREGHDIVVYGATSGGVAAAVQAGRMGHSVVLIEPGRHVGGLTSGGLGATDIGNKAAIGGISREFYRRVKTHYDQPSAWKFESSDAYGSRRQKPGEDTMWTFEPAVAEQILKEMLREAQVEVVCGERLDLRNGVEREANRIAAIRMESGRRFAGRAFLDCTYEGDLMAKAGISYHVGREASSLYGETLNGVQTKRAVSHQFMPDVDPYVRPGEPASGLLPGLHDGPPGEEGAGDDRVQAYCFRMCLTDAEENRVPFEKPEGYDPLRYELLLRNLEAGETVIPWSPTMMPNRKTDTNNNRGFSTDNIGMNYAWADGDYAERERIFQEHLRYQRGLMWTLANHPRVPESMRREVGRWGNCRDEFPENGGWSHQLYVREARRMISCYVMSQDDCQGRRTAQDPVGLAAYGMDSHNVQRYVDAQGKVRNEGDVQVGGFSPYGVSYRAIVPKQEQCENLLVPVCLSASHIAYGSIRMEPVFMVLGQSAATAAVLAIEESVPVQRLDYGKLRTRLLADGQIVEWAGQKSRSTAVDSLPGQILDDSAMQRVGDWIAASSIPDFVGPQYWHDNHEAAGTKEAVFSFEVKEAGSYEVRLSYSAHANRATNVPVIVHHAGGESERRINQRIAPPIGRLFVSLGSYRFVPGAKYSVVVSNRDADGHVIADAVQILPAK
jgi:hypothetical protein